MKYILDTNAVSALMKGGEDFIERLKKASKSDVYVPQPVLAESPMASSASENRSGGSRSGAVRANPLGDPAHRSDGGVDV